MKICKKKKPTTTTKTKTKQNNKKRQKLPTQTNRKQLKSFPNKNSLFFSFRIQENSATITMVLGAVQIIFSVFWIFAASQNMDFLQITFIGLCNSALHCFLVSIHFLLGILTIYYGLKPEQTLIGKIVKTKHEKTLLYSISVLRLGVFICYYTLFLLAWSFWHSWLVWRLF